MESSQKENPKQVCTINVVFAIESDEGAIAVKKKIAEAIADVPDVRTDFRIMEMGKPRERI